TGPAMLWTSADGATWSATALAPDAVARGVAALGDTIVAGGGEMSDSNGRQAVVWTSTNGTWSTDRPPPTADCADDITHVIAGPDGFLARSDCGTYEIPPAGGPGTTHDPDGADRMVDGPRGFMGIGFHQFVSDKIAEVHPPLDPLADLQPGSNWSTVPSLPVAAPMTAAATANGTIYVFSSGGGGGALRVDRFDPS